MCDWLTPNCIERMLMRWIAGLLASVFLSLPVVAQDTALKTRLAIDGQGNVIHDAVIVVHDGGIVSVRPNDRIPQGAREVDLTKFTVVPGLIDMHVHIATHFDESSRERPSITAFWAVDNARKYLESGFTTLRSLGAPNLVDVDLRNAINSGLIAGPRLFVSGEPLAESAVKPADGEAPMREYVRKQVAAHVDVIKIFGSLSSRAGGGPTYTLQQLKTAVAEAQQAGKPVAVHAHAAEAVRRAILAGADTVEHGALMDDAVIDLLVQKQVVCVPNLYLAEYYLANGQKFHFNEEQLRYTRDFMKPRAEAFAKALKKGAMMVFGTDAAAGMPGHTAPEFERRVALGMSTKQAITHVTSTPAGVLGMADKIGDLKPGMLAESIAGDGNPLDDIKALGRVTFVMKEGKIFKSAQ